MGKVRVRKRENPNVVVNIDYDKLADAVYRANMRSANERDQQDVEKANKKVQFDQALSKSKYFGVKEFYEIVRTTLFRKATDSRFLGAWMGLIASILLWLFGLASIVLSIGVFVFDIVFLISANWHGIMIVYNILFGILGIIISILIILIAIFSFCASREVENERDKVFLSSLLSGLVGLAALVIALVALVIGVRS